jgi:hypothetical protein
MKKFLKALVSSVALGELEQEKTQKKAHKAAKIIQARLHGERSSEIIAALKSNPKLTEQGFKDFLIKFIESNRHYIRETLRIKELNDEVNFESQRIFERINELYKSYRMDIYPSDEYTRLLDDILYVSNILLDEVNGPQTISAKIIRNRVRISGVEYRMVVARSNKNFLELNSLASELNALTTKKLLLMREADMLFSEAARRSVDVKASPSINAVNILGSSEDEIIRVRSGPKKGLENTIRNGSSDAIDFPRERMTLEDDGYKLYLAEKYRISRNELFQKYVCEQKFYDSLDDILKLLDERERLAAQYAEAEIRPSGDSPTPSATPSPVIRQRTYEGRVITLVGEEYKVNDVIQRFKSLEDAKACVDALKTTPPANPARKSSVLRWFIIIAIVASGSIIFTTVSNRAQSNGKASSSIESKPKSTASSSKETAKSNGVSQNQPMELNETSCRSISVASKPLVSGIARELQVDPSQIEFGKAVWLAGRGCYVETFFQNVRFICQVGEIFKTVKPYEPTTINATGSLLALGDKSGTTCFR